jgi:uroporphyrinogen decarboxylase
MPMNSKQRIYAAIRRQPVDRVPVFMWFHPETAEKLARLLDIPPEYVSEAFGDDIRQKWVGNNYAMEGITHERDGQTHSDFWGIKWIKSGPFNQISHYPLLNASESDICNYHFPDDHINELIANMHSLMPFSDKYFVGCDISPCLLEMIFRLRGMENALLDLAAAPHIAQNLLEKACDFSVKLAKTACEQLPFDWLWTGDDVGGQHSMVISPELWREMICPLLARIFAVGKSKGLLIAYHSCGAIRPIISDLIKIGVDVLNPIQCNCPGMEPAELKKEFSKKLTFMGGVDTQELLPYSAPDEVHRATSRLIEEMTADGGGYILAASHTVPPETPFDNIFAMYKAAEISQEEIFDRASAIRSRIKKER